MEISKKIVGWAVCYVPTKNARIFAGLKSEAVDHFNDQDNAQECADSLNMGGYLDELHIGYRVYPMHWLPKGVSLK
jgi:hypothetical protein